MLQINKRAPDKSGVVCIGNALMDIFYIIDDQKLNQMKLEAGTMHLIDEQKAKYIYESISHDKIFPGGSAANTAVGIASFGGKSQFIGKVKNDQLGTLFYDAIVKENIDFITSLASIGPSTGQSYILISQKDKERTMCTYLGAALELTVQDVYELQITDCKILFVEGYLWDASKPREAVMKALDIAKKNNVKIAFTLSDKFCVARNKNDFCSLIFSKVDILFGNKKEAYELFGTTDFDKVVQAAQEKCKISIFTLGAEGSIIISKEKIYRIEAKKVENIVDTTGAGDLYAAGVLYGLSMGLNLYECGKLGSLASAENVTHIGSRPQITLKKLIV